MPYSLFYLIGLLLVVAIILGAGSVLVVKAIAKREVYQTPKVPMNNCDVHGLYPASAAFHTTAAALGRPDLKVIHCPFCLDNAMKRSEELLRKQ